MQRASQENIEWKRHKEVTVPWATYDAHRLNECKRVIDLREALRDFKKIHVAIEIKSPEKPIYSIEITKATRHDSPLLIPLLEQINGEIGDVCGDKGLSSRRNAQYIAKRGGTPFLMMKKNSTRKSKGYPAWRKMHKSREKDEKAWDKRYHKRSNSEAGFSSFKQQTNSYLSSRNRKCQTNEI